MLKVYLFFLKYIKKTLNNFCGCGIVIYDWTNSLALT